MLMVPAPWTCTCGQPNAGTTACPRCFSPPPPWVLAQPEVPAPTPKRRRWVVPMAIVVVAVLVAGIAGAAAVGSGAIDLRPAANGDLGGTTLEARVDAEPGPEASEIERTLPELMRFVQRERGLDFKKPVKITLLDDREFRASLQRDAELSDEDEEEIENNRRLFVALGLLDDDVDLQAAQSELLGDAVAGYYSSDTESLVVRGTTVTPGRKITLVHELTHAVQDQHFDIDREDLLDADDESSFGLTAIVEGDAVRIEDRYREQLPLEEIKAAEQEELAAGAGIDPGVPRVLLELLAFPYIVGPDLTRAIVERGGQPRLDAAFTAPPTTAEQLLDIDKLLAGEPMRGVVAPKADRRSFDDGIFGQFDILQVLQASGLAAQGGVAARGWGGGRYVAWRTPKGACVRANVVMDTPTDVVELRAALDVAAADHTGWKVTQADDVLTLTACG